MINDATTFSQSTVIPAFEKVRSILERDGRRVRILNGQNNARLQVLSEGIDEFSYVVTTRLTPQGAVPNFETTGWLGGKRAASDDSLRGRFACSVCGAILFA